MLSRGVFYPTKQFRNVGKGANGKEINREQLNPKFPKNLFSKFWTKISFQRRVNDHFSGKKNSFQFWLNRKKVKTVSSALATENRKAWVFHKLHTHTRFILKQQQQQQQPGGV